MKLKPYPEYKDSGVPWLGKIPKHWEIRRFKYLLREVNTRSADGQEQLLSVSQYTGVTPRRSRNGDDEPDTRAASLVDYKRVSPNDLVVNIMLAWNGSLGVARSAGIVSPSYCVYRFNNHVEPWYYHNLLRLPLYRGRIKVDSTGVVESRLRLYSDDLFRIEALLPQKEEQAVIARFVDTFGQRVDRLIRAKRQLIELLNEQKQGAIHRAVTRGLSPNTRLKPSGIAWLGDVPEHWEIGALRRFWEVVDCKHLTVPFVEDGIPLASVVEVQSFDLDLTYCKRTTEEWYQHLVSGGRKPKRGDLIYCRNASVGACAYVNTDIDFAMGQDVCLITSGTQNQRYLNYLLHSWFMMEQLERLLVGSTFKRINISNIRALVVLVPPRSEQDTICRVLDDGVAEIASATKRANREIDLLREYRTRLIADVVTGKFDVRGVELPALDEAEALAEWEIDEDTEVDEMDAREGVDA